MAPPSRFCALPSSLRILGLAIAFGLLSLLAAVGARTIAGDGSITILWPPSGLLLGALLVARLSAWPAFAVAAFAAATAAGIEAGLTAGSALAFAIPSTAEGLLGAAVVRRLSRRRFELGGVRELVALVAGAAVAVNAATAFLAAAITMTSFDVALGETWLRWWSADALGMLAVAPLIAAPGTPRWPDRATLLGAVVVAAGLAVAVLAGATREGAEAIVVTGAIALPLILLAGRRGGPRGAALVALVPAIAALHFAGDSGTQVTIAHAFLAVLLVAGLAFAVAVAQRERVQVELDRTVGEREAVRADLQRTVEERESFRARLEQTALDLDHERAELQRTHAALERRGQELQQLDAHTDRVSGELARRGGELQGALREGERLAGELAASQAARASERASAQTARSELERELAAVRASLEQTRAEGARLADELASLAAERDRVERRLADTAAERMRLAVRLESTERELAEAREELQSARAQHDRTREELAATVLDRGRISRLLQAAERDRRLLSEGTSDLIVRLDDGGACASVTPYCRVMLGYEPQELVGRPVAELIHADDRGALERHSDGDVRMLHRDGHVVWVRVRVAAGVLVARDVSALRTAEERRRRAQGRFDTVFGAAPGGVALLSPDGRVQQVNSALCVLTGFSGEQLEAAALATIVHPEDAPECRRALERAAAGEEVRLELRLVDAAGSPVEVAVGVEAVEGAGQVVAHFEDLRERARSREQLRRATQHDRLTGLYSRERFEEDLRAELAGAGRYGIGGAVLVADLDDFADVNALLGRARADALLKQVADAFRRRFRVTDVVARTGADQFAVLLVRAGAEQAREAGRAMADAVRAVGAAELGATPLRLTASVGVTSFGGRPVTAEEVIVEAETALRDAGRAGGDRAVVFEPSAAHSAAIEQAVRVRAALDEERVEVDAHQVIALDGGGEARQALTLRIDGEAGEVIPSAAFLPAAERYGFAAELDRRLLGLAVAALAQHRRVEVALSGAALGDPGLVAFVAAQLRAREVEAGRLAVAIPEAAAAADGDRAGLFLRGLAELGVEPGLHRFGAGLGSFLHVDRLPVRWLRLDPALAERLTASEAVRLTVQSIAAVATRLGMRVVAAGVRDQRTLDLLRELGVHEAQGPAVVAAGAPLAREPGVDRVGIRPEVLRVWRSR